MKLNRFRYGRRLALAALLTTGTASAGLPPDYLETFLYPAKRASTADEIFALYADNCGRPHPDSARPAAVVRSGDATVVDIYLVEPASTICPAVVLPDTLHAVSIGRLPKGIQRVTRRLQVRSANSTEFRLQLSSDNQIEIGDVPQAAVSGSWFDASAPGSGMFINLLPDAAGDVSAQAFAFVLTRDAAGAPLWLGGAGTFVDAVLRVPLQPPGAADGAPATATAIFTYTGCGNGRLRVDGASGWHFPRGEATISQLTQTAGLDSCRPPLTRARDVD